MKPALAASFEATRHIRLPANAQIKKSARDYLVIDWLIKEDPPLVQRMSVIFDRDRDERVLDVLTAVNFATPNIRSNIVGVYETDGRLTVWYGCVISFDKAQRPLAEACYKALWPVDRWSVDVRLAPMRDGKLACDRLPENSPLLLAPEGFHYGLIEVRS